jgi:hypothetical protein
MFATGCVIAVPKDTKMSDIEVYLKDTNTQEEIPLHVISPTLAAEMFRQDPLSVIEKHGYVGYKVPFSFSTGPKINNGMDCVIPNGAINLKNVATNNQKLEVVITIPRGCPTKLPYLCSNIIAATPLYI